MSIRSSLLAISRPASIALALLLLQFPTQAWNGTGHRVIAAIAYDTLTPATRARVDDLVRRHPLPLPALTTAAANRKLSRRHVAD